MNLYIGKITIDGKFWHDARENLIKFHKDFILPEIVTGNIPKNLKYIEHPSILEAQEKRRK